jgi:hypothetical protein
VTLPQIGTTDGAQAANQSIEATSDASGNISFVGPSGIQGSTITCVVNVPSAPFGAVFTAILGTPGGQGVALDSWGGDSTAGKFQVVVGQTLVVTGVRLTPNTAYTCTFSYITDVGAVQVVIPDPNSSALLADIASAGLGGVNNFGAVTILVASGAQGTIPAPAAFQYWSWGWVAVAINAVPTSGNASINFYNPATTVSILDNITFEEGASDRLAGANFGAGTEVIFTNNFDFEVEFFVNYSAPI